jgi:hypothetical protein
MSVSDQLHTLARRQNPRLRQKLLTAEQIRQLPGIGAGEGLGKQTVAYVKLFGGGRWSWFLCEANALIGDEVFPLGEVTQHNDPIEDVEFYGYVVSGLGPDCDELAYFRFSELAASRFPPFGLPIERDQYFQPQTLAEALKKDPHV